MYDAPVRVRRSLDSERRSTSHNTGQKPLSLLLLFGGAIGVQRKY